MRLDDTITAIATPVGRGGIGIVRISGPQSPSIAERLFRPGKARTGLKSHRLYLGHLHDPLSGEEVDEVLLTLMKAPHSYTREDVVEINSHSGFFLLSKILRLVLDQGARHAEPGEFTFRAFMNGRIDLTQAEAVIDLINAKSERGLALSSMQIKGVFSKTIQSIRRKAIEHLAMVEAALDFPEEEEAILSREALIDTIARQVIDPLNAARESHSRERIWVEGVNTVIAGPVNAGKSSLLNRLLNEEKAIVTPVPGTTRDIIESTININGIPLRLMDTAGFRDSEDEVELIGVQITEKKLREAELVLVVLDGSIPPVSEEREILSLCRGKENIIVLNKTDLPQAAERQDLVNNSDLFQVIPISALMGTGLDELKDAISSTILNSTKELTTSHVTSNIRHQNTLENAASFFTQAARSLEQDSPLEIVASDIKSGLDSLGSITGETATEEILDTVFSRFCLGK